MDSHEATAGSIAAVRDQIEVETRAADSGFDLLVSLSQVPRIDAPSAAVVVNRLVENWLAERQHAQAESARREHDAAQAKLDLARRQAEEANSEYDTLVNQVVAGAGPQLDSSSQTSVADQARLKLQTNLERRLAEVKARRVELLDSRTGEHPDVIATGEELALLETRLRELQAESPVSGSNISDASSLRNTISLLRQRVESSRNECDRLAAAERAASDQQMSARSRSSFVWFPAVGVSSAQNSVLQACQILSAVIALLLAGLSCFLVPRPRMALRTRAEAERAMGVPVIGVLNIPAESAAA
jgi:hypothetical protein